MPKIRGIGPIRNVLFSSKVFGYVVFRGFEKPRNKADLESWYCGRGSPVLWNFGHVKAVKDEPSTPGFVTSKEGLPMHFDLMMPPPYMGVDQKK